MGLAQLRPLLVVEGQTDLVDDCRELELVPQSARITRDERFEFAQRDLIRRARLTLRLPAARRGDAARLSGQSLLVEGERVELGAVRERPLDPYPTLSAQFVATGAPDELGHQEAVQAMLEALGLPLRFICGRMRAVRAGESAVSGGGVVLHQLRPEQSLMVQQRGLGELRGLGCGLFLPHKIISGID